MIPDKTQKRKRHRHKGEDHAKTEAETIAMQPQAKEHL